MNLGLNDNLELVLIISSFSVASSLVSAATGLLGVEDERGGVFGVG